jgi:hypothetical protein
MKTYNMLIMKIMIALLFITGMSFITKAQTYPLQLPRINLYDDSRYSLESQKLNDYDIKFKIVFRGESGDVEKTFTLTPFTYDAFEQSFSSIFNSISAEAEALAESKKSGDPIKQIFLNVQSASITAGSFDERPDAGTICFNKKIFVRRFTKVNSKALSEIESATLVKRGKDISKRQRQTISEIRYTEHHNEKRFFELVNEKKKINERYATKAEALNRRTILAEEILATEIVEEIKQLDIEIEYTEEQKYELEQDISKITSKQKSNDSIGRQMEEKRQQITESFKEVEEMWIAIRKASETLRYEVQPLDFSLELAFKYARTKRDDEDTRPYDFQENRFLDILKSSTEELEAENDALETSISVLKMMRANISNKLPNTKGIVDDDLEIFLQQCAFYSRMEELSNRDSADRLKSEDISEIERFAGQELTDNPKMIKRYEQLIKNIEAFQKPRTSLAEKIDTLEYLSMMHENPRIFADSLKSKTKKFTDINNLLEDYLTQKDQKEELLPRQLLNVEYVSMEFNQGYIENMVVYGHLEPSKKAVKFTNVQPIGFSRKKDFDALPNCDLWTEAAANGRASHFRMNLSDLIEDYEQNLALNRRDYSPADGVIVFDLTAKTCSTLKKAPTYQLLEARVYSDFVGLDKNSPNGLIQTEIGQRINLITNRLGWIHRDFGGIINKKELSYKGATYTNFGVFGYIHPSLVISKIEKNNRGLPLDSRDLTVNNQYYQERFAATLNLRNYENLNSGFDLNILTLDKPHFKSTFYFDFGLRFGRTQVIDSVRAIVDGTPQNTGKGTEFGINTFRWYPKVIWEIKPEERYGLSMSYYWNQYYVWNSRVTQVSIPERYSVKGDNEHPFGYGTAELQAFFNPSVENPTGKLFFRYTFNHMGRQWNTNFHQAQVGYSFYLLGRNKIRSQD